MLLQLLAAEYPENSSHGIQFTLSCTAGACYHHVFPSYVKLVGNNRCSLVQYDQSGNSINAQVLHRICQHLEIRKCL